MPGHGSAGYSGSSGPPACVLLDEFASIGYRRNATTATTLTSARRIVRVSCVLADPPGVSRWFVHCPGLNKQAHIGNAQILNVADALVLMRMAFRSGGDSRVVDYFVYRAGPGRPSLHLIPGPCPKVTFLKQIGILPGAGEHYFAAFPVAPQLKPCSSNTKYEMFVFSSESQEWSCKVARITNDQETTYHEVVTHEPSKAIAAGGSSLAWIDLWRGVLLCNVLDEDPVLRLVIGWPVQPPRARDGFLDMCSPGSIRDATLNNGVIRFVESNLHDNGGWTATVSKRETSSKYWHKCFKADIVNILATNSSYSDLLRKVSDDEAKKVGLNKVFSAPPTLSLSNEDVVYFMTELKSEFSEPLLLAFNVRGETGSSRTILCSRDVLSMYLLRVHRY